MTHKEIAKLYLSTKDIAESQYDYIGILEGLLESRGDVDLDAIRHRDIILDIDGYETFKKAKRMNVHRIINTVSNYYSVDRTDILGTRRLREYVAPRQVVCYLAKELRRDLTLKQIGAAIGGRDHSTVIHAVRTVNNELSYKRQLREDIEELKLILSK